MAFGAGVTMALAGPAVPARAAVWGLQPQLSTSTEYSTNPQLRLDEPRSGYAGVLDIAVPIGWDDGLRHFEIAPRARVAVAGGDSSVGANGSFLTLRGIVPSELSRLTTTASWADDSSAFEEPASGTLTRTNVRRRSTDISAVFERALTSKVSAELSAARDSVDYAAAPGSGLYSYRYSSATAQLTRAVSDLVRLQLVTSASEYQIPGSTYQQNSYSAQAGVGGQLAPRWSYTALYGVSRVTSQGTGRPQPGTVYLASLEHQGLRWRLSGSATQSIQPSGFGVLARAREVLLRGDWQTSERGSIFTALRSVTTTDSFATGSYDNRSYRSVLVGSSWRVTAVWDLSSQINWQRQRIDSTGAAGSGLGVGLAATRSFGRVALR